jgi:predicted nucleic acid-binding protein
VRLDAAKPTRRANVRFVDTNVPLYAALRDEGQEAKVALAKEIMLAKDLALSVQVLQEFYVQATREGRPGRLTHERALGLVVSFCRFPVASLTADLVAAAMATRDRFQISYWDAAILEAARSLGCETVLSEDLGDGQDYGGVVVENPFSGFSSV